MVRRAKPDKAMANGKVYRHTPLQPLYAQSVALWKPDAWWRDERSGAAVIVASIKLAYYLLKVALERITGSAARMPVGGVPPASTA